MSPIDLLGDVQRVLFIGAHCDDIEIGCGATVRRLVRTNPECEIRFLVLTSTEECAVEAKTAAERFVGSADAATVLSFRDGHLPFAGSEVKDAMAEVTAGFNPDLVFAHYRDDFHQDYRFVGELAWQLFRNSTILEYEVPKWDGDLSRPNLYVPADDQDVAFKVDVLPEVFPSQTVKPWFDAELLRGLMRLRGMECKSPSRYAEAFHAHKVVAR
jgi:LmbE family N-acetylglucosaminyl deacetylase